MERDLSPLRHTDHPIDPLFRDRWSPRAMSGAPLPHEQLMSLFEAARWAPSAYNAQPWRFVYATRDSEHWSRLFDLLVEFNQGWCRNAAVLIVIVAKTVSDSGKPSRTYAFDCGAAWENLALQATRLGLVAHGMSGFDYDRARSELGVPEDHAVIAMVAVGQPGAVEQLPEELREREVPSSRRPVTASVMEGRFRT